MLNPPVPLNATRADGVVPRRWHGALVPIGVASPGGVTVFHPDHPGAVLEGVPADARVPVDLERRVPLTWNTTRPGETVGALEPAGRVEAAWLAEGVLHVAGSVDLAVPGLAEVVSAAAAEAEAGGVRMSLKPWFVDVEYGELAELGTDYYALTRWRLGSVELCRPVPSVWPVPLGLVEWLKPGQDDPSGSVAHRVSIRG